MKVRLKAIMLIATLALIVPVLLGYTSSIIGATSHNQVLTHSNSKAYTNADCVNCHTTLTENGRDTEGGNIPGAHRKHFLSVFLNFVNNYSTTPTTTASYGCAQCHEETVFDGVGISNAWTGAKGDGTGMGQGLEGDLSGHTTVATVTIPPIRKQVDPAVCLDCHGTALNSAQEHSDAITAGTLENCGADECHGSGSSAIAVVHASSNPSDTTTGTWGIDQRYANSFSYCPLCHGGQALYQSGETTGSWTP